MDTAIFVIQNSGAGLFIMFVLPKRYGFARNKIWVSL